ncbi:MAG: P-loop NTPase [Parvibaculum sp.]|uniref:nucleotide-binding protein n=1 Tax=Parvibaculum sp. TaxID=2024848 RepID=UPI001D1EFE64|nr:P-loop NTPase [Parvibaculum sp.]MBX3488922.1 P-loop NTPase [Parvibaculum sp.]MBX3496636.1 P-loop NTPase [Parvibaculum sp.]MCW5727195.1 P-loop NTPase [Parvibaculum sp.]
MNAIRMIQVASGKGGIGKTWFAVSIAHALAAARRRVLLFDGDLGLANIDVQLGLSPRHDLGDVISGRVTLAEAIVTYRPESMGGAEAGGSFDILAGKSGSGVLSALTRPEVAGLATGLVALSDAYDHIVSDLAAGLDQSVMSLCVNGGITIVLVSDEPTSLTDAYAFIKLLTMQEPGADIRIVVNMANDKDHARRTHAALTNACRNFLGIDPPFLGFVPRDELVRDAIRHQMPILFRHPQARASEAVQKIAREILILSAGNPRPAGASTQSA